MALKRKNENAITNLLSVIALFLIAHNIVKITKKDFIYQERRDDCADVVSGAFSFDSFIKKYNIGENDEKIIDFPLTSLANNFCRFYARGGFGEV